MSALEILRAARGRISDPALWCTGSYTNGVQACAVGTLYIAAGDKSGGVLSAVDSLDDTRAAFVALYGAIFDAAPQPSPDEEVYAPGEQNIYRWNDADNREHADVLAVFDTAIAAEEAKVAA